MADPIRDFLADEDGDLAIVNADFATVGGKDAIPQGIDCRVRTWFGEIFLDESQGVLWKDDIFIKNPDPTVVREDIREAIADTPDVTDVVSQGLSITPGTRDATTDYGVATIYSTETLSGSTDL